MNEQPQLGFNFESEAELLATSVEEEVGEVQSPTEVAEPEEPPEVQSHVEAERNGQLPLINIGEWWEEHWKGMPEFVQKDLSPYKTIYVHFENREDMEAFGKLVSQRVGLNTRSIWYPEAEIGHFAGKSFIDVEPEKEVEGVETFEDEE